MEYSLRFLIKKLNKYICIINIFIRPYASFFIDLASLKRAQSGIYILTKSLKCTNSTNLTAKTFSNALY